MPKKSEIRRAFTIGALAIAGGLASPIQALADDYAYEANGNGSFGVIDLTTGVFTHCGTSSALLSGFGVGPDHKLYGGAFEGNEFYSVDTTNGALTPIGASNVDFWLTGSTTDAVYAIGTDKKLYSIDVTTGQGTLIGSTKISVNQISWYGLSTNSKALYYTYNASLYNVNLKTGRAELIGTTGHNFGAEVFEGGRLYGGAKAPLAIFTLDTKTGAATLVSDISGPSGAPWALAPIKSKSIPADKLCSGHRM